MNNQNGVFYQNGAPYPNNTLGSGGLKGFFDRLSPMTMKIVCMVLVVLTLLTFLLPWWQMTDDMIDELDDNGIDIEEIYDELLDQLPASSQKRDLEDMLERAEDFKTSLSDMQFVLAKTADMIVDTKEVLEDYEDYYDDYGYGSEYEEAMEMVDIIILVNIIFQIVYFGTVALGLVSLVSYWLDRRYSGWGLTVGIWILFVASIADVIVGNIIMEEEMGFDEPFNALGVGGFFAIILAFAASILWKKYLERMPAGGVGINAFRQAFAARQPAYPNAAYQQPMNNGYAQPTYQQPVNNGYAQPTYQQPVNNGYAQPTYQQPVNNESTQYAYQPPQVNDSVQQPPVTADMKPTPKDDIRCIFCGKKCAKGNLFCPNCGNPLPKK